MTIQEDLYASDIDGPSSGSGSGDFSGSGSGASGSGSYMPDIEASLDQGTGDIMFDNHVAIRKLAMGKPINMRELGELVASVQRKINAGVTRQVFIDEMTNSIKDYYPKIPGYMVDIMQPTLIMITNLFDHLSSNIDPGFNIMGLDMIPVNVPGLSEDQSTEDEKKYESEKQDNVQDKEDNEVNGSEKITTPVSVSRPSEENNEEVNESEKDEEDEDNEDNE